MWDGCGMDVGWMKDLPLDHGLFGVGGKVVGAGVAVLGLEGELLEEALVSAPAARTHHPRREQDRSQHFLFLRSC